MIREYSNGDMIIYDDYVSIDGISYILDTIFRGKFIISDDQHQYYATKDMKNLERIVFPIETIMYMMVSIRYCYIASSECKTRWISKNLVNWYPLEICGSDPELHLRCDQILIYDKDTIPSYLNIKLKDHTVTFIPSIHEKYDIFYSINKNIGSYVDKLFPQGDIEIVLYHDNIVVKSNSGKYIIPIPWSKKYFRYYSSKGKEKCCMILHLFSYNMISKYR